MNENSLDISIGAMVAEKLSRSRVFEKFGIDYCCGGNISLAEACKAKGIDAGEVMKALVTADAQTTDADDTDWRSAGLNALIGHIESTHHVYLTSEFPRLSGLMEKVVNAHAAHHPELTQVSETLTKLTKAMTDHLASEENDLFPMIRQLNSGGKVSFTIGKVAETIRTMEEEHDNAGDALASLRSLTNEFQPPEDACTTYQALLAGLAELELDTHQHIHKENSILHPRAIALEEQLKKS